MKFFVNILRFFRARKGRQNNTIASRETLQRLLIQEQSRCPRCQSRTWARKMERVGAVLGCKTCGIFYDAKADQFSWWEEGTVRRSSRAIAPQKCTHE